MKNYQFTVVVEKDESGHYLAICPSLQGCYTEGQTKKEALTLIKDAIRLHLQDRIELDEPIYEEVGVEKIRLAV